MAGAGKKRQQKERKNGDKAEVAQSSNNGSSQSPKSTEQTSPVQRPSPPSAMDGNRDPTGSGQRSRASSVASASGTAGPAAMAVTGQHVFGSGLRIKNLDLGYYASTLLAGYEAPGALPLRIKTNKTGREVNIKLNTFNVTQYPKKPIYQYDVSIGSGNEKRGLITRVWNSKKVREAIKDGWIFDGNKIAWCQIAHDKEFKIEVDLDKEDGKDTKKAGKAREDKHKVYIRKVGTVRFDALNAYLNKQTSFSNDCLEAINFLDHLMRETPSRQYTQIRRNFFSRGQQRTLLGGGIEAFKGVYASIRTVSTGLNSLPTLSVNVDVANGTFWTESALHITALQLLGCRDPLQLGSHLAAGKDKKASPALRNLHRMHKLYVYVKHRGNTEEQKARPFCIAGFLNKTAEQHTFLMLDKNTNKEREISVFNYFLENYNIRLQYPQLPVVQMTKKNIVMPMEICYVKENQRFPYKLSDKQTSEMIKFAVTLPEERWKAIEHGLGMLKWKDDPYLNSYGLRIDPTPVTVKARLLPNPKVQFGGGPAAAIDPGTNGRWDLRGKKFLEPHATPLKSWGVCVMPGRFAASKEQVEAFLSTFIGIFQGHGGRVANHKPIILKGSADIGVTVEQLWNQAGNQSQAKPQLLVFIMPEKDATMYQRIKKSADCRFGVVSQVLQSAHVQKNQAQYCSNVAMKVNAKLGGITARAIGINGQSSWFKQPTMIIGADVSHGAPGSQTASIASMTVSWDRLAIRYAAAVETNGQRVEMITKANIDSMLLPLVRRWMTDIAQGQMPQHIIYVRDGVSEGQYAHVINQEVHDIRFMFKTINPKVDVKFTVVIASKRHHVRFFPDKNSGDRNGNPRPGTLVESGVTHPFEYDFYLCAHSAIKGTARPVHYHVLMDEQKMSVEELQNMIYEASYQYVRSTTPVSLFPAVYYAHLASNRGTSHIDQFSVSSGPPEDQTKTISSGKEPTEVKPLIPMKPENGIRGTMWYV